MLTLLFSACIAGCASDGHADRKIIAFYKQARERLRSSSVSRPVDLDGLTFTGGVLPGSPKYPEVNESSIIVSDPDPSSRQIVQVIVSPRVSGSFLDPEEPSPEFLRQIAASEEEALRTHQYTGVILGSKPQAEQGADGNPH